MTDTSDPLKTQIEDLVRNIKSTAGSRFGAAKRLEHRDKALTRLTAFTSAYIIILTVFPYFIPVAKTATDHVNLATVALAIIILVSSLFQYSNGDIVNSEQHHRCALEMKELRREIKARVGHINEKQFLDYSRSYSAILQKYSINHDDVDYLRHKLENPKDYELDFAAKVVGWLRLVVVNSWPNVALLSVSAACVALAMYAAFST